MAYARKSRKAPTRRGNARRAPARRSRATGMRRRAAAPRRGRSSGRPSPQVIKIVLEQSSASGLGMGGMDQPQIMTQIKKARL